MPVYSITYDLIKAKDYSKITEGIVKVSNNNWSKPTRSQWIIPSSMTCVQVRDFLKSYIDYDDVLFVVEITPENWAAYNLLPEVTKWLNS